MKRDTATKAGARLALIAGTLVEGRRLRTARYVAALAVVITAISILAGAAEDGGPAEPSGQLPPLWERLVELLPATVGFLERMRPLAPDAVPPPRLVSRCQARVAAAAAACARDRDAPAVGCAAMFARSSRALAARASGAAHVPLAEAAEAASRVALLLQAISGTTHGRCAASAGASSGEVPAVLALLAGGSALRIEPAAPLTPGATYRLRGKLPADVSHTTPALSAGGTLAGADSNEEPAEPARIFVQRVRHAAERTAGLTPRPAIVLHLSRPVALREIRLRRVTFRPEQPRGAQPAARGPRLRIAGERLTAEVERARAAAARAHGSEFGRLLTPGGPDTDTLGLPAGTLARVGAIVRSRFPSLDMATGTLASVPFLLALPRAADGAIARPSAIVLLLHGLGGTGAGFLREHADALAAQGLAAAAFDLPAHGARAAGRPFLDPLDPEAFAGHLCQAAADTVALAATLGAGRALPVKVADAVARAPVRLLGYSLGGITGALVLGAAPEIGAAVLVAPAGDLFNWVGRLIAPALGLPLLSCAGGTSDGAPCAADGNCAGGGTCTVDTAILRLSTEITTAYRTVLAEVDPQTLAARAAGPARERPILLQEGTHDGIIDNSNTEGLAAALGADMTCRLRRAAPQTLCRFQGAGHGVITSEAARRQAYGFLASGGTSLTGDGAELAAR